MIHISEYTIILQDIVIIVDLPIDDDAVIGQLDVNWSCSMKNYLDWYLQLKL